jgi:hypothetical protein
MGVALVGWRVAGAEPAAQEPVYPSLAEELLDEAAALATSGVLRP